MELGFQSLQTLKARLRTLGAKREGETISFRVWAPERRRVEVVLFRKDGKGLLATLPMDSDGDGFFHAQLEASERTFYMYRLDGEGPFPDPASRAQPFGVHGPSEVYDDRFSWTDAGWKGVTLEELVIYELHVGTATREGTFEGLIPRLAELRALGVTAIELMPIASFPGRRNWGYDGVGLFAPQHTHGGPFGLKRLVDAAHRHGLGVILDVVYNHLGPDGNYLRAFSPSYFTDRKTPWGDALDFGRPGVRELFLQNAEMWIREYRLDGLRLDATHAILDDKEPSIVREISDRARAAGAGRRVLVMAEDDRNERKLVLSPAKEKGGLGLDAVWADDLHHQIRRALAGDKEGYFADFTGSVEDLVATLQKGWFYQGQKSAFRGDQPRGTRTTGIEPPRFIHCLQNHDQVGNRALGDRLGKTISPAAYRTASALLCLSPYTPLLFMGQEWNASTPFLYFTDHAGPLGKAVRDGRRAEFKDFSAFTGTQIPDPQAASTFERSVLDWSEKEQPAHAGVLALYKELLSLRAHHPALRGRGREQFEVGPISETALALKRRGMGTTEMLLVVNLGGTLRYTPPGHWKRVLFTEESRFGGTENGGGFVEGEVRIEGPGAVVLETAR